MADTSDLSKIRGLLREGKVQEADNEIGKQLDAAKAASPQAQAEPPSQPAPRPHQEILHDLLSAIVDHLGSHPRLMALLEELRASLEKKQV